MNKTDTIDIFRKKYSEGYIFLLNAFQTNIDNEYIYMLLNPSTGKFINIYTGENILQNPFIELNFKNARLFNLLLKKKDTYTINFGKKSEDKGLQHINIPSSNKMSNGLNFNLAIRNEKIKTVTLSWGFYESLNLNYTYQSLLYHYERVSLSTRVSAPLLIAKIAEKAYGLSIPHKAEYLRSIFNNFFILVNHLTVFIKLSKSAGDLFLYNKLMKEYYELLSIVQSYSGHRYHLDAVVIGGIRKDVKKSWLEQIKDKLSKLYKTCNIIRKKLLLSGSFKELTAKYGLISKEKSIHLGLSGVILRASGIDVCIGNSEHDTSLGESGSILDRFIIRLDDMQRIINIINKLIDNIPDSKYRTEDQYFGIIDHNTVEGQINNFMHGITHPVLPKGDYSEITETANGIAYMFIRSDGTDKPEFIHFTAPSQTNIPALEATLDLEIKQFEYFLLSLNLDYNEFYRSNIR